MSTIIGIDPGLKGAVAFLDSEDDLVRIELTPTIGVRDYDLFAMSELIASEAAMDRDGTLTAYIEDAIVIPGKTSPRTAKVIGFGQGLWQMALMGNGVLYTVVEAKEWQKVMFKGIPKRYKEKRTPKGRQVLDTKLMSIIAAKRRFSGVSLRRTEKCRKDDHNTTDALLIAAYGRRQISG